MKYAAQDTKPSAIYVTILSSRAVYFHTNKVSVFLICFIVFYTNLTHLLNKQTGFFDKMCQ